MADVFVPGRLQQLVVTVDSDDVCTYLDGVLTECATPVGGSFSNWERDFPLLIGNEATGNRPWLGSVARVAIFDHPLTAAQVAARHASGHSALETGGPVALFTFSEGEGRVIHDTSGAYPPTNLDLPRTYVRPHSIFSKHPRQAEDYFFNFFLYFPLGFLLYASLVGENPFELRLVFGLLLGAVLVGGILEFLQHYIIGRTSSMLDLANGTVGAMAGMIAASAIFRAYRNSRSAEKKL